MMSNASSSHSDNLAVTGEEAVRRQLQMYVRQMEEIKQRTDVVKCFVAKNCGALYDVPTVECQALQIRKILELIALGSLVANEAKYKERHVNFARHWKAKEILKEIEKVNPAFYPQPTRQVVDEDSGTVERLKNITDGFLTREEYEVLYDDCSDLLHARNPFTNTERDVLRFGREVPVWMNKIVVLLNHHCVQLSDSTQQIWVMMNAKSDGKAQAWLFERIQGRAQASDKTSRTG